MSTIVASLFVAGCVFAGALFGLQLHRFLPQEHLTKETQEVVKLGTGTLSVLASLVLGLLIATSKTTSDTADREMRSYAADLILLNGVLQSYGGEAEAARTLLRRSTEQTLRDIWPKPGERFAGLSDLSAEALLEQVQQTVRALAPTDSRRQWLQDQAVQRATSLVHQRWLLIEQSGPTVQPIVLGILVSWIVVIFASFGLNAPRNGTVIAAFAVCSLGIGGAVFLVLEMDDPFQGVLHISEQPMLRALARMGS